MPSPLLPTTLDQWLAPNLIVAYVLTLVRVSGMMMTAPWFNQQAIPLRFKAGLAFILALILLLGTVGIQTVNSLPALTSLPLLITAAVQELAIGVLLGTAAYWVTLAFQAAGELVSIQMGLSMATALDPASGAPAPITGKLMAMLAVILLLSEDVHHALIKALAVSLEQVPLAQPWLLGHLPELSTLIIGWMGGLFALGLSLALPVMGILLLAEVAMGFLAKLVPQMNIFMVGLPFKVMLGLWAMAETLPYASDVFTVALRQLNTTLLNGFAPTL